MSNCCPLRVWLWAIALVALSLAGCQGSVQNGKEAAQFLAARNQLHHGQFNTAFGSLVSFIESHPDHHLVCRATFLAGKAKLGMSDLDGAAEWFQRTLARFPETEEAHKAKYKLAMVYMLQNNIAEAMRQLASILDSSPGPYSPEAAAMLVYLETQVASESP